ncbi:unnamed protein product [Laminaria digitata]
MKESLLAFALVAALPCLAKASEPTADRKPSVKFKTVTLMTFGDLAVSGEVMKPEATLVRARLKTHFQPLIRYRGDFRPELLRSLDNL